MLNYRFGTCLLFGGDDKDKAIGHLKFAVEDPGHPADRVVLARSCLPPQLPLQGGPGRLSALSGHRDKKELAKASPWMRWNSNAATASTCLSNLKEITVRNKVEVDDTEFFRFYDLSDIGGKIVVTPEELKCSLDKKSNERTLVYLPEQWWRPSISAAWARTVRPVGTSTAPNCCPTAASPPPMKLAGYINTDQDEDYAFMHPDGKTFYFSSKGHNSMGGYDVFRTTYDKGLDAFGRSGEPGLRGEHTGR